MSVLLDTCVVSELRRPQGEPRVKARLAGIDPPTQYLSVITIGEVANGVALLPDGARRQEFAAWLLGLEQRFAPRVLPIDIEIARLWGEITAQGRRAGIQIPPTDGLIAATARRHGMYVVTRNSRHFAATGVAIIDPWAS